MTASCDFTRTCTDCKTAFPATKDFFHAYKRAPDGCRAVCRVCRAKDHAENREERLKQKREHWAENKDRLLRISRSYYAANLEAQRKQARERYWRNRDDRLQKMREYREANYETLIQKHRVKSKERFHEKYGVDFAFTLQHRIRSLLRVTLKNGRKSKRMLESLGYSIDELKLHLEKQFTKDMCWDAFMAGQIHIDHILPVSSFKITSAQCDDFKACWSLSNLRPMWASENMSKGKKMLTLL